MKKFDLMIPDESNETQKFMQLLTDISWKFDDEGIPTNLARDCEKSISDLQVSKGSYLNSTILLTEMKELTFETVRSEQLGEESEDIQVYKDAEDIINVAESIQRMPQTDTGETALGLSKELVTKSRLNIDTLPQQIERIHNTALPKLEDRLYRRCEDLCRYYNCHDPGGDVNSKRPWQLSKAVSMQVRKLRRDEKHIKMLKHKIRREEKVHLQIMIECLDILIEILQSHVLEHELVYNRTKLEWMKDKFNALLSQLSALKERVLVNTYTSDSVKALTDIKLSLNEVYDEALTKCKLADQKVKQYDAVGSEFAQIVSKYTKLQHQIKHYNNSLQQLQES